VCRPVIPSGARNLYLATNNATMKKTKIKMRQFTVVIEQGEDGYYVATVPSLPSCYTQARTLEALAPRIREVIALCLAEQKTPIC
jgi:predicted RNase H-like HicB family nuclease